MVSSFLENPESWFLSRQHIFHSSEWETSRRHQDYVSEPDCGDEVPGPRQLANEWVVMVETFARDDT